MRERDVGVSVGLWAEYEVRGGFQSSHVDGSFSGSRYSASTVGAGRVGDVDHPRPAPRTAVVGPVAVP